MKALRLGRVLQLPPEFLLSPNQEKREVSPVDDSSLKLIGS